MVMSSCMMELAGEILVLDMGESVKIVNLAKDMIRFLVWLRRNENRLYWIKDLVKACNEGVVS